jgi:hypothetical protein
MAFALTHQGSNPRYTTTEVSTLAIKPPIGLEKKMTKCETMMNKILHIKLKMEQHEHIEKRGRTQVLCKGRKFLIHCKAKKNPGTMQG